MGICLACGSEDFALEQEGEGFNTWRCPRCLQSFTISRDGDRWRLYREGTLVSEDMTDISGRLGMYDNRELIPFFESSSEPKAATRATRKGPRPAKASTLPPRAPDPGEQEAYWQSIAEQGGDVPRRYAYLLPKEGRKQRPVLPGSFPTPRHVLDSVITDVPAYLSEIPSYVRSLAKLLAISEAQLDGSVESMELVDAAIRQNPGLWLTGDHVRCVIAYAGELIRTQVEGVWISHRNSPDDRCEPLIRDEGGTLYNPWLDLYKGILEGEGWALTSTVYMETHRSPKWRDRHSVE